MTQKANPRPLAGGAGEGNALAIEQHDSLSKWPESKAKNSAATMWLKHHAAWALVALRGSPGERRNAFAALGSLGLDERSARRLINGGRSWAR
jgi:hypothetical protein